MLNVTYSKLISRLFYLISISTCEMVQVGLIEQILIQINLGVTVNFIGIASIWLLLRHSSTRLFELIDLHLCLRSYVILVELLHVY